ncbi:MAG: hypothetical protein K1X67_12330 [Fimbriimonadaceae bacterium]|nr:hypothetical protein [Fimbriimonadaceae bacterium]
MVVSAEYHIKGLMPVASLEGAWLEWAVLLDHQSSGFLAFATCAKGARRHCILWALGLLQKLTPDALADKLGGHHSSPTAHPLFRLATSLRVASPRETIDALFGECPAGFLGFLNRLEPSPMRPGMYRVWAHLFAIMSPRAKVAMQSEGTLTSGLLDKVLSLDEVALRPAIVARLGNHDPEQVNACVDLIRRTCSSVADAELTESLTADGTLDLGLWVTKWLGRRMDRLPFPHPISADDPDFEPVATGPSVLATSRRFGNCLHSHRVAYIAAGKCSYAVGRHAEVVVEFRRLTAAPFWLACEFFGPGNTPVDAEVCAQTRNMLAARGLPFLMGLSVPDRAVESVCGLIDYADVNSLEVRDHYPVDVAYAQAAE